MDYKITRLSEELVYIRWLRTPKANGSDGPKFLADLQTLLDDARIPQYFISDLRHGRITDLRTVRALGQLAQHPRWGGSTAFGQDPIAGILVHSFRSFTASNGTANDDIERTPENALAFLNKLKPGLVDGIDWDAVIHDEVVQ